MEAVKLRLRETTKGFSHGRIDVENDIFFIMTSKYGMADVCANEIDYCDAIYSRGFCDAIEEGLTPILNSQEEPVNSQLSDHHEYHHLFVNDKVYSIYFE
jgi:hypothetical protein